MAVGGSSQSSSQPLRSVSRASRSSSAMRPTTLRTSFSSTVQICPLMPLGTFSPASAHRLSVRSAFASCDVTGTTNRSPGQLPRPTTIAGLTFELLRSVNGIGSKTRSLREQGIVNVVRVVVPNTHQRPLSLRQPLLALSIVLSGFNRDMNHCVFSQLQRLKRPEFASLIDGSDGNSHVSSIPVIFPTINPFPHQPTFPTQPACLDLTSLIFKPPPKLPTPLLKPLPTPTKPTTHPNQHPPEPARRAAPNQEPPLVHLVPA